MDFLSVEFGTSPMDDLQTRAWWEPVHLETDRVHFYSLLVVEYPSNSIEGYNSSISLLQDLLFS